MTTSEEAPLLRLESVAKTFPNGTVALRGVDLCVERGTVHGLLGANGAGKSTLIKTCGALPASGGQNPACPPCDGRVQERPTSRASRPFTNTYQSSPILPVLENVFLGTDRRWRRAQWSRGSLEELFERVGYWLNPDALVGELSIGQRQMVAIFQALSTGAELIVMDEPTASLATEEREVVVTGPCAGFLESKEKRSSLFHTFSMKL